MFDLMTNPFVWQGVVFAVFAFVVGISVHSIGSLPKHILDAL